MKTLRKNSGFTLLEVMVVMVIIGLMAALIVPNVMGRLDEAKLESARTNIKTIDQALRMYRLDNGRYPTQDQGLKALIEKPALEPVPQNWKKGGYIAGGQLPKDPWNRDYQYLQPGVRMPGEFDVFTLGEDAAPGGEEMNADIGNWAPAKPQ